MKKDKKADEIILPAGMEMVGIFKLKDKEGKKAIKLTIKDDVKAVFIQKFTGENNKIIVAVETERSSLPKIILPKDLGKIKT